MELGGKVKETGIQAAQRDGEKQAEEISGRSPESLAGPESLSDRDKGRETKASNKACGLDTTSFFQRLQ